MNIGQTPPRRRKPAQALVEMAVALPVLLMLIMGLIGIGQILLANYAVSQAARAAAHQAALAGGDTGAAERAAEEVLDSGVGTSADRAEVSVSCPRSPCRRYDPITVSVLYSDELWAPAPFLERFYVSARATRAAERDSQ
jgi:hypothetical protein